MVVSSRCAGPSERARFAFLGQSVAGRRMTAEDELEQPSGSGRSTTLALRKTLPCGNLFTLYKQQVELAERKQLR